MQCLTQTESRAQFSPDFSETIEIPTASGNLYRILRLAAYKRINYQSRQVERHGHLSYVELQ